MKKIIQDLKHSFLHLVFPASCIHCHELLAPDSSVLCSGCATLLELLDPEDRCVRCFNLKTNREAHCRYCVKHPTIFYRTGAVFSYTGPPASIVKKLKYGCQPYLAKGAGAFLIAQFERLNWPIPDAIVPVPISFFHWLDRGFNQSVLLANELASALQIPVWHALKRSGSSLSQAGLSLEQRKLLGKKQFKIKGNYPIEDKHILLLDDVMTSGTTLTRCAEVLYEKCPQSLYALTFCKTEEHS
jgi:ComF family protein